MGALKRVALVRLDALGDTLLTTPAVRVLLETLPDAEVLAVTHPVGTPVLAPLCSVLEVSPADSWRAVGKRLAHWAPDLVLCCSEKRRAALASWASRAPLRVGFAPGWRQPLKAAAAKLFFHRVAATGAGCHEAERYVRLVECALGRPLGSAPPLMLQPPAHYYSRDGWTRLRGIRVGIQLSAKWCRHGYRPEHLQQWIDALPEPKLGFVAPLERVWARRNFPKLRIISSADLYEYATWLQQLQVLVTIDTGAAHVAAALQVPVVDVFPERDHERCVARWKPWQCPHRIVLQPPFSAQAVAHVGNELRTATNDLLKCGADSGPET